MRQTGDVVRNVCQPRSKVADGIAFFGILCFFILIHLLNFNTDLVLGIREGKFPEDKALKVNNHYY